MKLKFWGWGYEDTPLELEKVNASIAMLQQLLGMDELEDLPIPSVEGLNLRVSRFSLPGDLASVCTDDPYERARHTYGNAFRDVWRTLHGDFTNPPDYVAFPKTEEQIMVLMRFAGDHQIALVPYGGGTSVCGGVEGTKDTSYQGWISVDMRNFNQILEIDRTSRAAHIQAGMLGPAIEAALKPHGLTLRHYPQSFEFSTLGGWIATRAGGHFATLYTHIDEFVQNVRMVTPTGTLESRRLPGSGAGPSEERFWTGSEGIFGFITSAWMRLQDAPIHKRSETVQFPDFRTGAEACRLLAQSGLFPTNARLIDPFEAAFNGLGDGQSAVLILGFESHQHVVDHWMEQALKICTENKGTHQPKKQVSTRDEKADSWKNSFLRAPYMRDELLRKGFIAETFETAITWDQWPYFYKQVKAAAVQAVKTHCGKGVVTCRFTHLYPDGPAPYFTIMAAGAKDRQLEQWDAIKKAVSDAIMQYGGTITHHHAVGKDHQPHYEQQRSDIFGRVLTSTKKEIDPNWVMNPEVLIQKPN
ncbi:MAG: FAD-binding oxidoreductase [Bacteroidota bacterium]